MGKSAFVRDLAKDMAETLAKEDAKKREAEKPADDAELCAVCLDAPRSHAFVPCGHMVVCGGCSAGLKGKACVMCRAPAIAIIKIFKS